MFLNLLNNTEVFTNILVNISELGTFIVLCKKNSSNEEDK